MDGDKWQDLLRKSTKSRKKAAEEGAAENNAVSAGRKQRPVQGQGASNVGVDP